MEPALPLRGAHFMETLRGGPPSERRDDLKVGFLEKTAGASRTLRWIFSRDPPRISLTIEHHLIPPVNIRTPP